MMILFIDELFNVTYFRIKRTLMMRNEKPLQDNTLFTISNCGSYTKKNLHVRL